MKNSDRDRDKLGYYDIAGFYLIDSTELWDARQECYDVNQTITHLGGCKFLGVTLLDKVVQRFQRVFFDESGYHYSSIGLMTMVSGDGRILQHKITRLTENEYYEILEKELFIRELGR